MTGQCRSRLSTGKRRCLHGGLLPGTCTFWAKDSGSEEAMTKDFVSLLEAFMLFPGLPYHWTLDVGDDCWSQMTSNVLSNPETPWGE